MAKQPWRNGYFVSDVMTSQIYKFTDNQAEMIPVIWLDHPDTIKSQVGTITTGDFGPVRQEILDRLGGGAKTTYELKIEVAGVFNFPGIASPCGNFIYFMGVFDTFETLTWLDEAGLKAYAEKRDPQNCNSIFKHIRIWVISF